MKILDGSELAGFIKERQAKAVRNLRQEWKIIPKLAIVQTINDPVIDTYVRLKSRYAADILVECELHHVSQAELIDTIDHLNGDDTVHGIIVQLPLADVDQTEVAVQRVAPEKDVDGLGTLPTFDPATPLAIHWLLSGYGIDLLQKKIALVGHGRLVNAPLEKMWKASGLKVTVFGRDRNLEELRDYDLIVAATGEPGLIKSNHIAIGTVVVDAGTADANGQILGDLAEDVRNRDDLTITPIKGGVGPLTIAALIDNVITAARRTTTKD